MVVIKLSDNSFRKIPYSRYDRLMEIQELKSSRVIYAYNEHYTNLDAEERYEPIIVDEIELVGDNLISQLFDLLVEYSYNNRFLKMIEYKIAKPMIMEIGDVFLTMKCGTKIKMKYKDFFTSFIVDLGGE